MTIFIAVLAVCVNTCQFAYTSDGFETKEQCVSVIRESVKGLDKALLPVTYGICIPVNVPKFV